MKNPKFNLNSITLEFKDNTTEQEFRDSFFNKSIKAFRLSFILVTLLYAFFGYLDFPTSPEQYLIFYKIRFFVVIPLLTAVYITSFTNIFKKIWQFLLNICFLISGTGIIAMLILNPTNIYYYAGMFLIYMAGFFFIKLRFKSAVITAILLCVIYNIGFLLFSKFDGNIYMHLIATNSFYISAILISIFALYNIELLERQNYINTISLTEKSQEIFKINNSLETQVIDRTKELVNRNNKLTIEIEQRKKVEKELITAKEKAEESDKLKTAFLHNVSHEIRTPMNGIIGFIHLMLQTNRNQDKHEEYLKIIEKSGERMITTLNNLLDISRIETGHIKVFNNTMYVDTELRNLYDFFASEAKTRNLDFIYDNIDHDQNTSVITDSEKIYAILSNLVKNALKYTREGSIHIGYNIIDNNIEFYVKDTGIGIPQSRQKAVFDRFVQADIEDLNVYEGTGLGLSIANEYAKMLGATIRLVSEVDKGSTFYLSIPFHKNELPEPKTLNLKSDLHNTDIKKLKILIADDELVSMEYLTIELQDIASEFLYAEDGQKAVDIAKETPDIDLILMDIKMPLLNGFKATKIIKGFAPNIKIIAQTAYALSGDKEKSIMSGCDGYISKPINIKVLFDIISEMFLPE